MLDKLRQELLKKYSKHEKKWMFLNWIDQNWDIIFSNWVIETDEDIDTTLELLYNWIVKEKEEHINKIIIDIVDKVQMLTDDEQILSTDVKKYWFLIIWKDNDKSWVILPDIEWVADAKHSLSLIKSKYEMSGKVVVYSFTTNRIII